MSEQSNVLVPEKAEEASDAQKGLMLLLNEQICALFEQDDVLLHPSAEMNRDDLWVNLKIVRDNPSTHVGYWFGAKIDVNDDGSFWLNVNMTVWPPNGKGGTEIVFLTPNQTHWICNRLKTHPLLRERLVVYVRGVVVSLRDGLTRVQETVEEGKFWEDTSKNNQIFDVVTGEGFHHIGLYTSWNIFLDNVCPPPPWTSRDPNLQRQWNQIKIIGGRIPRWRCCPGL